MTNQLQGANKTNKFMYLIFPLYVCKRKRKLIYNWTVESRRTNQIFIYLSFQLSLNISFKANAIQVGGVLPHSSRSNGAGTEPPGLTTEAVLRLNLLPCRSLVQTSAQQCRNRTNSFGHWSLVIGYIQSPAGRCTRRGKT